MVRTIYVREIITILKDPRICPVCEKDDKLEVNEISENHSGGKTFLCTRCEALTIVTTLNLKRVELSGKNDTMVLLKEPYNIRRVSY
jgi:hypothetical protein